MKYQVGDVVSVKHMGKIGIVICVTKYEHIGSGYHVILCGMPDKTYYYYEHEIEKFA